MDPNIKRECGAVLASLAQAILRDLGDVDFSPSFQVVRARQVLNLIEREIEAATPPTFVSTGGVTRTAVEVAEKS